MRTYIFDSMEGAQGFIRRLNLLDRQCHRAVGRVDDHWKVSIFPSSGDSDLVEKIDFTYGEREESVIQRQNAHFDEVRDEEEI